MKRLIALFLLWPSLALASMDFDGVDDIGMITTAVPISATPLTMSCMFVADVTTADDGLQSIQIPNSALDFSGFFLLAAGAQVGNPIRAQTNDNLVNSVADSTAGFSAATVSVGTAVIASATDRRGFFDGANKGTNTTSRGGTTPTAYGIGGWRQNNANAGFFDGRIAECGVWSVALSDRQVASLGKHFTPLCVARSSVVAYYPMVRDSTSLKNQYKRSAPNVTLTGTMVGRHLPVIRCDE